MKELKKILEEVDLRYALPVQPVILPRSSPWPAGGLGRMDSGGFDPSRLRSPSDATTRSARYKMSREESGNAGYAPNEMGKVPGMSINTDAGDRSGAF